MIKIRDNLYQGGLDDLSIDNLMIHKFGFVVNVADELEPYLPNYIDWQGDYKMTTFYYCMGLFDDSINQKKNIDKIIDFMVAHNDYKILVICSAGLSRSPYICAKYLSIVENRTMDDVYKELKELNHGIDDNSPMRCNDDRNLFKY